MLKRMLAIAVLPFCFYSTIARTADPAPASPEEVVRAYTEAANRHDVEGLLALYAPSIRKFRFPGELTSEGIEHNRAVYSKSFPAAPHLKIDILELFSVGDKVVVHDRVTGRPDNKTADEITVYQVQDGRITNIVYVEQQVR
jgi:hypothetical protein